MIFPRHSPTLFRSFLILSLFSNLGVHAINVTLDDQDPAISYSPPSAWTLSVLNTLDYGGAHMQSRNDAAVAEFQFTGTAVYFLSARWPYPVSSSISLDSGPENILNLSKPAPNSDEEPSHVVWSATGLANTIHIIRVQPPLERPMDGYAIVDGFIYTSSDDDLQLPPPSTEVTLSAPIPSPVSFLYQTLSKRHVLPLPIALGTVLGLTCVCSIALGIWYFLRMRRFRRKRAAEAWVYMNRPSLASEHNLKKGSADQTLQTLYTYGANTKSAGIPFPTRALPPHSTSSPLPGNTMYDYRYTNVTTQRAPNRYQPGDALSTITEKSTPQMNSPQSMPHSPSLKESPLTHPGGFSPSSLTSEDVRSSGYNGSVSEGGDSTKVGYHETHSYRPPR